MKMSSKNGSKKLQTAGKKKLPPGRLKYFENRLPSSGGLFTKTKRLTLLGKPGRKPEGELSIQSRDFWYDVRQSVKAGLYDLQLFIETAPERELATVLTAEALKPSIQSLLWNPMLGLPPDPTRRFLKILKGNYPIMPRLPRDPNRASIAQLLIELGFAFLSFAMPERITLSHQRTILEAVDLAKFVAESAKPNLKRRDYTVRF